MLFQSATLGAKKLLVDDKEICVLDVVCKVSSGEAFCFSEKRLLSILHFVLRVTYCLLFYEVLIGRHTTFLECIVILL